MIMLLSVNHNVKSSALFKLAGYFLFILLLAMPVADFFTVVSREYGHSAFERASLIYRALILVALTILCSVGITRRKVIVFVLFFFGNVSLLLAYIGSGSDFGVFAESLLLLLKFFLFFLFYQGYLSLHTSGGLKLDRFYKLADFLMIGYAAAIVAGAAFSIDSFSYYESGRWGVKGIVVAGNEASALLIVSLAWFLMKDKSIANMLSTALIMVAMIISGTKASMAGLFMLVLGFYWASGRLTSLYKIPLFIALVSIVFLWLYHSSNAIQYAVASTWAYFEYQFYHHAQGSILSLLLSGRDLKLGQVYELIFYYSPWSLIIGGYPVAGYTVEMDFFDLIALLGIVGSFIYIYSWLRCWASKQKATDSRRRFKFFFLGTFLLLAFLGGHMFYSAVAAPFLALLAFRFSYDCWDA